jgi:hypothetical protein
LTHQVISKYFFSPPPIISSFWSTMGRSPSLARNVPKKRSKVEEEVVIKRPRRKPARKPTDKRPTATKNTQKTKVPARISKKKDKAELKKFLKKGRTRFILLILM